MKIISILKLSKMTINLEFILNENSQYIKVTKDDYQPHEKRFFEL